MIAYCTLMVSFSFPSAVWRAVFVAALALIAFVLTRYWKSLSKYSKKTRYLLIGIRAASLLLLTCILSGLSVEYEAQMPLRILVQRIGARRTQDNNQARAAVEATERVITSLRANSFEIVDSQEMDPALKSQSDISRPDAVIGVTDGAMTAKDARFEIERVSARAAGAPVFVVTEPQDDKGPRVALVGIIVTNRPVRGVPFIVRCIVHARGMSGRATLVTVSDDAQVRASVEARWTGDDEQRVVTLEVVPKTAGWINYIARAEAGGREDSVALSRPFTVYAEERRQRVLFLEGEPTWEAKFIRRALDKAELFDVDYFAQVSRSAMVGTKERQAGTSGEGPETKSQVDGGSPDITLHAVLSSAARLNTYDCIIVGAMPDSILSNAEGTRLREWVERRGGGLIVLGGNNFSGSIVGPIGRLNSLMPAEINSANFRSDSQTLSRSTPVEAEKPRNGTLLTPTEAGQEGPLGGYSDAITGTARPGILSGDGFRLGALRRGATVLAVTGAASESGTSNEGAPQIAAMRYGAGRTIAFAPSDSWRMRTTDSGDGADNAGPFAALWQGLTLWASSSAGPPVEVVMNEDSPAAGSEATVELRVRDAVYTSASIEKLSASFQSVIDTADGISQSVASLQEIAFAPDPADPSIWRARFTAPEPGRYSLQLKYTAKGVTATTEKYFATVPPLSIEADENRDALRRLARETGGDLIAFSDLNVLKDRLAAIPRSKQNIRRTWELRTWWPFALFIPLLLSCEWLFGRIKSKGEGGKLIL